MSEPEKYEREDEEIEMPAADLFSKDDNRRYMEKVKKAEHVSMMLNASWEQLSKNKSSSLIEHINFAKAVVEGINKAGDQFYVSLGKSKFPVSKIKYYVELLLKETLEPKQKSAHKMALNKKQFMQIAKDDMDGRILKLTKLSIKNMKNPTPYKLRNMKALDDTEFQQVIDGDATPYEKVDKRKQTKDELERSKIDFSKEHEVNVNVIEFHLKDVRANPLKYVELNLELAAQTEKLERLERVYKAILTEQLIDSLAEPEQLVNREGLHTPARFFRPSQYRTQKMVKDRKTAGVGV
jgi:hypothetical protein